MPEIRDSSFDFRTATNTTLVLPAVNVVAGDLMLAIISIDTGTSAVTATGWTELFRNTSTSQLVVMYKISDGTEGDVTFTYALETCVGCMISIKDVNTTNPFGSTPIWNVVAGGTTAKVTMQTVTTNVANSLLLFAHGRSTIGIPSFLEGPVSSIFAGDGGAESLAVGWGFQASTGTTPANVVSSGISVGAGPKAVIQICPPSGGATVIPTYCAADSSLYIDPINGTSAYNGNTALAITADTGFSTSLGGLTAADAAVTAVADVGINSFHSVGRLTSISASKNLAGLELVILDANRPNVTGKNVLVHVGPSTEGQLQRFSSVASGRGIWFGMRSAAASNWKIWQVYGVENGSTRHSPVIINESAGNTKSTNGTLDTTLVKAFGFWVSGSGVTTTIWDFASLWALDTCTIAGGIAAFPINIPGIVKAAATGKERKSVVLQGTNQALLLSLIQIGDGGTNPVYLDLNGTAIEFPRQYNESTSQATYNSADNICGLIYYAGASDTIKHRNSVVSSASRYKWGLHASSSTSASYDFSGLSVIGAGTITLNRAITITELTINDYSTLDVTGLTMNSCTILNMPATSDSITTTSATVFNTCSITTTSVTAGNRWASVATADLDMFTSCTFTGSSTSGHAIRLSTTGTVSITGNTFTTYGPAAFSFHTQTDVDPTGDTITKASHGYATGNPIYYQDQGGTDTIGLIDGTLYYVRADSSSLLGFFPTSADATNNTNRIALSDGAAGQTHYIYSAAAAIYNNSGGAVTINVTNGTSPSIRNSDGSSTTVNNNVTLTVAIKDTAGSAIPGVEVAIFQDNTARTVVLASTPTNASGEVSTSAAQNLGAIIIRARQNTNLASFLTSATGIDDINDYVKLTGHKFQTGDKVSYSRNGGSQNIGISDNSTWWLRAVDTNNVSLHPSVGDAIANTNKQAIAVAGSETHKLDPLRYVPASATGTIASGAFSAQITMITDDIATG